MRLDSFVLLDFHNRPHILLFGKEKVISDAENDDCAGDQTAVIHGLRRCRRDGWPEDEKQDNDQVDARENVVDDSQNTWQAPRAPDQAGAGGVGEAGRGVGREFNATCAAAVKEETGGDEIGAIEAGDGEGDDIVESGRGADVDQRQQASDDGGDGHGPEWNSSP